MRSKEEIQNEVDRLKTEIRYLYDFLRDVYKDNGAYNNATRHLKLKEREVEVLKWVIDNELPF